jgi:DNA-binding response OmpR family regulator
MDKNILVIEDEPQLARLVEMHLRDGGFGVDIRHTGTEGLARAREHDVDLVVLDLMLPDMDGLDICRSLRSDGGAAVPILILTARSDELDRVLGLEMGADDYLTKPFSVRELVARVKAILRRTETRSRPSRGPGDERFELHGLLVDAASRSVLAHGKAVHLTAREFDLLLHFARHPGRVFTRTQLLDAVWGYGGGTYEHTVNSHINRLRSKIELDPAAPSLIQTVWGVGYRFGGPDGASA